MNRIIDIDIDFLNARCPILPTNRGRWGKFLPKDWKGTFSELLDHPGVLSKDKVALIMWFSEDHETPVFDLNKSRNYLAAYVLCRDSFVWGLGDANAKGFDATLGAMDSLASAVDDYGISGEAYKNFIGSCIPFLESSFYLLEESRKRIRGFFALEHFLQVTEIFKTDPNSREKWLHIALGEYTSRASRKEDPELVEKCLSILRGIVVDGLDYKTFVK